LDVFWTSQIELALSGRKRLFRKDFAFSKMVVGIKDRNNMNPRHVFQFGTAALGQDGNIVRFFVISFLPDACRMVI